MQKKLGELYNILIGYLHNYCRGELDNILDKQSISYILRCLFHVPKDKQHIIIKELEANRYIEQVNRGRGHTLYKILK